MTVRTKPVLRLRFAPAILAGMVALGLGGLAAEPVRAQAPAQPAAEKVLMRINGEAITERDLRFAENEIGIQLMQIPDGERRAALLEYLIEQRLLAAAADKDQLGTGADFEARLAYFKRRALRDTYFDQKIVGAVAESEARAIYDEQVAKVGNEDEIRASHILVPDEASARDALERLRRGDEFGVVARELSKDPGSAEQGGDLGYFSRGQMVPQFEEAAFTLEIGKLSDPVQSQFGWHVIQVTDKRKRPLPTYEQVRDRIMAALLARKRQDVLTQLKGAATIEVVDSAVEKELDAARGSEPGR